MSKIIDAKSNGIKNILLAKLKEDMMRASSALYDLQQVLPFSKQSDAQLEKQDETESVISMQIKLHGVVHKLQIKAKVIDEEAFTVAWYLEEDADFYIQEIN